MCIGFVAAILNFSLLVNPCGVHNISTGFMNPDIIGAAVGNWLLSCLQPEIYYLRFNGCILDFRLPVRPYSE